LKYKNVRQTTFERLPQEWNFYLYSQDTARPLFVMADNSVFIAPVPKNSVANGIQYRGIRNIIDWTLTTTEDEMKIPYQFHEVLVFGLASYIYSIKTMNADALSARQEYERRRDQ
jgi:hypothetical protein